MPIYSYFEWQGHQGRKGETALRDCYMKSGELFALAAKWDS